MIPLLTWPQTFPVGCVIKIENEFEILETKTLVCMDIHKRKNAFSEKFGLFYLPRLAPEGGTMKK